MDHNILYKWTTQLENNEHNYIIKKVPRVWNSLPLLLGPLKPRAVKSVRFQ